MLKAKLRENRPAGSGEEDFEGFLLIWSWRPAWSCDQDAVNRLSFPYPMRLHIKFGFDWPSGFRGEDV